MANLKQTAQPVSCWQNFFLREALNMGWGSRGEGRIIRHLPTNLKEIWHSKLQRRQGVGRERGKREIFSLCGPVIRVGTRLEYVGWGPTFNTAPTFSPTSFSFVAFSNYARGRKTQAVWHPQLHFDCPNPVRQFPSRGYPITRFW